MDILVFLYCVDGWALFPYHYIYIKLEALVLVCGLLDVMQGNWSDI